MTWLRAKVRVFACSRANDCGQSSRAKICGQSFDKASRAGKACGPRQAQGPLHQLVLLQRMQARLQHGARHGSARAVGRSFTARQFDRRPLAQDHRIHQAQQMEIGARMDVVLVETAGDMTALTRPRDCNRACCRDREACSHRATTRVRWTQRPSQTAQARYCNRLRARVT